ncbi:hypothetical protein [Mucilaginibacter sp.]|uniref:hypothetical protein n=1 Tax=Mucilaginibacter sp. TaxID=1882438 RepID=UPI00374CDCF1
MKNLTILFSIIAIYASSCSRHPKGEAAFLGTWKRVGKTDTSRMEIKKNGNEFLVSDKNNGEIMPSKFDEKTNCLYLFHNDAFSSDTAIIKYVEADDMLILKNSYKEIELTRVN